MSGKNKILPASSVRLIEALEAAFSGTDLKITKKAAGLALETPGYTTNLDFLVPGDAGQVNGDIEAVVKITTRLPDPIAAIFREPAATVPMNALATLGALTMDDEGLSIGSRLTLYGEERALDIYIPLLLFSALSSAESLLGGMRVVFGNEEYSTSPSDWNSRDFAQVASHLERMSVCTSGPNRLTAEFPLHDGSISAAVGDPETALWTLQSDQPHPTAGGGLLCLLQLPHSFNNEGSLDRALLELNRLEMGSTDQPPHFGAWCRGGSGANPAYITFLPNGLHDVKGLAVNISFWAAARARIANERLGSMGYTV